MHELKLLAQLPLVMAANRLTWNSLSKEEKDELLSDMFVAIAMEENQLLYTGMKSVYDWCLKNYSSF